MIPLLLFPLLSLLVPFNQAPAQTYIVHAQLVDVAAQTIRPDIIDLRQYHPYEQELAWYKTHMEDQLRRYLACGITTVIDDGATPALLAQRDTFAVKPYAPRIFMAGPLLSTGYTPTPFDVLQDPDEPFYPVNTPTEAVALTEKQYAYRPDLIKVWYIVSDSNTAQDAASKAPMVKAAILEAHAHHYKVSVHATQQVAAQLAVTAGADFLVHEIDDEVITDSLLSQLKARKVVVCPTLTVITGYSSTFAQRYQPTPEDIAKGNPEQLATLLELPYLPDSALSHRYRSRALFRLPEETRRDSIRCTNLRKMEAAGVFIATGTDAGNIGTLHASSYFKELRAMRDAGLSNWQVLVASTLNGAKALGKEWGTIRPGKAADLLLLDGNPVEDLSNLERINRVVRAGVFLYPDSLLPTTPTDIVQRQVNAYNAHDLEGFLRFYADTATLYNLHGKVLVKRMEGMRKAYSFLNNTPGLHVTIVNRMVIKNKVVDHEVAMVDGRKVGEELAIYSVEGGKISKVWFVQGNE